MLTDPRPTCSEVRRELESLALNELRRRDATTVRGHLARCDDCALAAAEVARLVVQLRALAPKTGSSRRHAFSVLAAAACVAVVVLLEILPPTSRSEGDSGRVPALAGLLAAQGADGAWRENGNEVAESLTLGLSGLATLSCLRHGGEDPASLAAGRRGCDYLVQALSQPAGAQPGAQPDQQLRAQAAAAWALGVAAERWPGRYRQAARKALRELAALEHGRAAPDDGLARLDEVTGLFLRSAHAQAAVLGLARPSEAEEGSVMRVRLARRLSTHPDTIARAGATVTTLASQALAESLPESATTF